MGGVMFQCPAGNGPECRNPLCRASYAMEANRMKPVVIAGITFSIDQDDLVAVLDGVEVGRTTVADGVMQARWLRVQVEHAAYENAG